MRAFVSRSSVVIFWLALALIGPTSKTRVEARNRTLDIYFIDVEGGQSTLIVMPGGESLLIDAGFPGGGTFQSIPGDPQAARDTPRIVAAAKAAGISRIDYLLITHFHADHAGGVVELARALPIGTFVDHGTVPASAETNVPGTLAMFERFRAVRATHRHIEPRPGDRLPLKGVLTTVVSSGGTTINRQVLAGRLRRTPDCAAPALPSQEAIENPRSTGVLLEFGNFRFLDLGDLAGPPLHALACPVNLIGPLDVYLVSHHGGVDAADPSTFAAFRPRVAILNNGTAKGGAPEMFAQLQRARSAAAVEDVWQLHRSENGGARNFAEDRIANLDETTAYWIKVSASRDGSFRVTNARTNATVSYPSRKSQ